MTLTSLNKFRDLMAERHGTQKYGEHDYIYHLDAVHSVLVEHGYANNSVEGFGGYGHDSIEDVDGYTKHMLIQDLLSCGCGFEFAVEVADACFACTDGEGATRKERKAIAYVKLSVSSRGRAIKVADRIANMRQGIKEGNAKRFMYLKEDKGFRSFQVDGEHVELWATYDELIQSLKDEVEADGVEFVSKEGNPITYHIYGGHYKGKVHPDELKSKTGWLIGKVSPDDIPNYATTVDRWLNARLRLPNGQITTLSTVV